jgi:hypothetical protein
MYIFLLFLNLSALEGGEWSPSRPGRALPPGKEPPVPIVQEAGWAPEPVWTQRLEEKSSASVGDRTATVLSVVRHCTDWATWLLYETLDYDKIKNVNHLSSKTVTANLWTSQLFESEAYRSLSSQRLLFYKQVITETGKLWFYVVIIPWVLSRPESNTGLWTCISTMCFIGLGLFLPET